MFIATLIAGERLASGDISAAMDALAQTSCFPTGFDWLEPNVACDLRFGGRPVAATHAIEAIAGKFDVVVQLAALRAKKLLVADMDSTIITVECLDELADYAGLKTEVAAITERAMRGELDFAAAVKQRVALLAGLDKGILAQCHDERVRITPGAAVLVRTMREKGARCILVSGGFSAFVERVAAELGFPHSVSSTLEVADGRLTGRIAGQIVNGPAKLAILQMECSSFGLKPAATLAIGDGANDVAMIEWAGLGVAWRAKPITRRAADARLDHGDLTALLYAQGWPRAEWAA